MGTSILSEQFLRLLFLRAIVVRRNIGEFCRLTMCSRMRRILCYGDSLTAGYYPRGWLDAYSPYGKELRDDFTTVDIIGMSGYTIEEMRKGLDKQENIDCFGESGCGLRCQLKKHPYDFVCLMAGTNDVGGDDDDKDLVERIRSMALICLE